MTPCYRIDGEYQPSWDLAANGYRLLTEAEWEYSCRAGTQTRYSFGDDEHDLGRHAWYADNADRKPHPVAGKDPNPWRLYDMHGNSLEWVQDCWQEDYRGAPGDGSAWESGDCQNRVLRGGAFDGSAGGLRSAVRDWSNPMFRFDNVGFRCARGPRRQP